MTRDEAINIWRRTYIEMRDGPGDASAKAIDGFVELGMLTLDEPTSKQLAYDALKRAGYAATLIMDELECLGLEIVKKDRFDNALNFNGRTR